MNMSRMIDHLKMQLGLYSISLPFKDPITNDQLPVENVIRDVLVTATIPIFSQFRPLIREGTAHVKDLEVVDEENKIYKLPAYLTRNPIMYVSNVEIAPSPNRGSFGEISPAYGLDRSYRSVIATQAYMMVAGQMRSEPTCEYLGHNQIKLYGFPKTILSFKIACEHDANGESIEQSCYESVLQLATLDMKIFLYNNLKMYNSIPTAYGNIELKIDDYQSAEADRTALLNNWTEIYHLDMDWHKFM